MNRVALGCLVASLTGFLSLSQEILFVRLVGFAFYSTPEAFAFVLAAFLVGIAAGAAIGKRICTSGRDIVMAGGFVLLAGAILDAFVPRLAVSILESLYAPLPLALLIALVAAIKSVVFPIAHQLGASGDAAYMGRSISRVYACNIAGATLGPLVTGFWLLDQVGAEQALVLVAAGTLATATLMLAATAPRFAAAGVPAGIVAIALAWAVPADVMARLVARDLKPGQRLSGMIERKSGVIHTIDDGSGGPTVFGGNVHDGRISTSLVDNRNGIDRSYILQALHPRPQRALVIGMSTGAWTEVLSTFPDMTRIDVVEINPAYLDLVRDHDVVAPLLRDPRVTIHIDDGRRWLNRHPDVRYDLVVMNTTLHWRAYATNLLSREFMALVRPHLAPGGVFAFNTTNSPDSALTAASVYPFVRLYNNAAYCAEADVTQDFGARVERLYALSRRGTPVLLRDRESDRRAVELLRSARFVDPQERRRHVPREVEIVTDDNMITEFRYGLRGRLLPQIF